LVSGERDESGNQAGGAAAGLKDPALPFPCEQSEIFPCRGGMVLYPANVNRLNQAALGSPRRTLPKVPSGIQGLDEVLRGGLPRGRSTLVCGGAGCGKSLLGIEFLVRGIVKYGDPGVYVAFEETADELAENVRSLGFDLPRLIKRKQLAIDYVRVERSEIEETGEYDLGGLFVRLQHSIDSIRAKRVVLDTVEMLFAGLQNASILRAELRRLFRWLKDKKVTSIVTGERGEGSLTRYGLEEYVADCVILLDHRVTEQISTRRLRVVKYRGSAHEADEHPFLLDENGVSVVPVTSLGLTHTAAVSRISSGVPQIDAMLGKKGYYRGSSVLVAGTAGTGKSSLAAAFVNRASLHGETCIYFSFEESKHQILRNMKSIGIDLSRHIGKGSLRMESVRPTSIGLEGHLASIHNIVLSCRPSVVVIDPITNLISIGERSAVKSMLTRLIDFFKVEKITALFTNLTSGGSNQESTGEGISSLMDTWIVLRDTEKAGKRVFTMCVLKSRGMEHSHEVREFQLSRKGIRIGNSAFAL
jgi:circadian clock protein KaiC